jgi:calreticulin
MKVALFLLAALVAACSAEIFFEESFGPGWEDRWVSSTAKGAESGEFKLSAGKYFNNNDEDKGLQTSQDARFYGISAAFPEFTNEGKTIYVSFRIKHEQTIDCGGGYVKVFPTGLDQKK